MLRHLLQTLCIPIFVLGDLSGYSTEGEFISEIPNIRISSLKSADIEGVVSRQWFTAAGELVKKSHEEGVDISAPIRNGVAHIRSQLDNLVKLLDPEYVRPQVVNPAFQWAQSDTTIFILLKYSRRFNAPGAVEVENFNCTFTDSAMFFSAIGEHSGKRFEYQLNLDFFDFIDPDNSKWTQGSVGKVTITIPKVRITRWPRLLVTNSKIDNMHYWFDYGEKLESSISDLPEVAESGLTCKSQPTQHFYCLTSDKCKDSCSDCKGKKLPNDATHMCEGPPAYGAKEIVFSDSNPSKNVVSGTIEIHLKKDHHKSDIEFFNLYLVEPETNLTTSDSDWIKSEKVVENITRVEFPSDYSIDHPIDLIAVPANKHGERRQLAVRKSIVDLFSPDACDPIPDLAFTDTDGDKNSVKGLLTFSSPTNTDGATHVVFYWGKDELTKLSSKSKTSIGETTITSGKYNITSHTSIPSGGLFILGFAKSSGGESDKPIAAVAIDDRHRPQSEPGGVRIVDRFVEITRATREIEEAEHVSAYLVRVTDENNKEHDLDNLPMGAVGELDPIPGITEIPEKSKKVCVYLVNELGRAKSGSCAGIESSEREEL